jgi:hypothetical protein
MASLYQRIGKPVAGYQPPPANPSARGFTTKTPPLPAPNLSFTNTGNPAGQRRSQLMGAAQGVPNQGYQPPGLSQAGGATPLARPPQAPPDLSGAPAGGMQGGYAQSGRFAPRPGGPRTTSTGKPFMCFVAGTKVAVSNKGTKNIEDVEVGDLVACYDTISDTLEESAVTHTFKHPDTDGYLVVNESLGVTPNHEIYTGTGWVSAGNLEVGDNIQMIGGGLTKVSNIEKVDKSVTTHNLEVANRHNYYADGVLVHNKQVIRTAEEKRNAVPDAQQLQAEADLAKYGPGYEKNPEWQKARGWGQRGLLGPGGGAGRHGGGIRTTAQAAQKRKEYLKDPRWRAGILARQEKLKNNPWQQPTGGGMQGGQ